MDTANKCFTTCFCLHFVYRLAKLNSVVWFCISNFHMVLSCQRCIFSESKWDALAERFEKSHVNHTMCYKFQPKYQNRREEDLNFSKHPKSLKSIKNSRRYNEMNIVKLFQIISIIACWKWKKSCTFFSTKINENQWFWCQICSTFNIFYLEGYWTDFENFWCVEMLRFFSTS